MGWATTHFQFCVVTLPWCQEKKGRSKHDRRTFAHDQGPARACIGVPKEACCNRPPWVLCRDRVGSPCVAIRFWATGVFVSRHNLSVSRSWCCLMGSLLCRNMTFCVVIAALQCGTEVCCDNVFSIVTGLAVWCRDTVFWCCDRARLVGRCRDRARAKRATESTTRATEYTAYSSFTRDKTVLSCGTVLLLCLWALLKKIK